MDKNYLITEHRRYIDRMYGKTNLVLNDIGMGDIITFMYENERRWIFVVTPIYEGKLHGLDLVKLPRRQLMWVANLDFNTITPQSLYRKYLIKEWIKEYNAYRTYDRSKMRAVKDIGYDRTVQPREEETVKIPDPKEGGHV